MALGPEDMEQWGHPSNQVNQPKPPICHNCGQVIVNRHCANDGCPWCGACGIANEEKPR